MEGALTTTKKKVRTKKVVKKVEKSDVTEKEEEKKKEEENKKREKARHQVEKRVQLDKKIFHLQQQFIDSNVNETDLREAAVFFQPQHYQDVVVERALDHCCGYPCCPNRLQPTKGPTAKYKLSVKDKRVYDAEELKQYCSTTCLISSKLFSSQLLLVPPHLRTREDLMSVSAIKFAGEITTENENAQSSSQDTIANVQNLILPYGNSNVDKPQMNISIQEREDVPPPSLDFSSASTTSNNKKIQQNIPTPSVASTTLPPATISTTTKDTKNEDTNNNNNNNNNNTLVKDMEKMHLTSTLKPSSMRKNKLKQQAAEQNKKGVQFSLPNKETTKKETEREDGSGEEERESGAESGDSDAGSLYGMQDSSDDEGIVLSMSPFGILWSCLENWKTPKTLSFLNNNDDDDDEENDSDNDDDIEDGNREDREDEEQEDGYSVLPDPSHTALRRRALTSSIFQQLPGFKLDLQINYPLDLELGSLISTFSLKRAIPSFTMLQWKTIVLVFIELLSLRSVSLRKQLNGSIANKKELINKYKINKDEFNVFVDIFKKP